MVWYVVSMIQSKQRLAGNTACRHMPLADILSVAPGRAFCALSPAAQGPGVGAGRARNQGAALSAGVAGGPTPCSRPRASRRTLGARAVRMEYGHEHGSSHIK
ncbi:hypothetical protein BC834DRAFT_906766 [Gloeopeniophorella convolvens]|nr:hypothetical protein BC834DRAFT_906766 [Gloeopeniophorella convolvens]